LRQAPEQSLGVHLAVTFDNVRLFFVKTCFVTERKECGLMDYGSLIRQAYWTLAYLRLTGHAAPAAAA